MHVERGPDRTLKNYLARALAFSMEYIVGCFGTNIFHFECGLNFSSLDLCHHEGPLFCVT